VLGPAADHPGGTRVLGGFTRAATQHYNLCVGRIDGMRTDPTGLLAGGLELVLAAWHEAESEWGWSGLDRLRLPLTFPEYGDIGPASLPLTLAGQVDSLATGDRVLCMGVGSGLNTAMIEIAW